MSLNAHGLIPSTLPKGSKRGEGQDEGSLCSMLALRLWLCRAVIFVSFSENGLPNTIATRASHSLRLPQGRRRAGDEDAQSSYSPSFDPRRRAPAHEDFCRTSSLPF